MRRISFAALILALAATAGHGQFLETVISLGHGALRILWNPASNKVYTANYDNTVSIINGATNAVIATLPVPDNPGKLVWNSTTNRIYVACGDGRRVAVIDGWTDAVVSTIVIPGSPTQAVYSTISNKLYLGLDDGRVTVVDGTADTVIRTVRVQTDGYLLLLWHPLTNRVLCSTDYDTIAALDCATDQVVSKIPTGFGGGGFIWNWCYNPVNELAYVGGWGGVLVLTAEGDSIITRVPGYVSGLCFAPFPNKMYLQNWRDEYRLGVLDCDSNTVTDSIAVYGDAMVCDIDRGKVYASFRSGAHPWVTVLDPKVDTVIHTFVCTPALGDICWNETDGRVYVIQSDLQLYVFRDTTTGIAERPRGDIGQERLTQTMVMGSYVWLGSDVGIVVNASGRVVGAVRPGRNDVSDLPVGVYAVAGRRDGSIARFVRVR